MPLLSKDDIQAVDDRKTETVAVPEWGGDVLVRSLTESEYDDLQDSFYSREGKAKSLTFRLRAVRIGIAAACICDENRKPISLRGRSPRQELGGVNPDRDRRQAPDRNER